VVRVDEISDAHLLGRIVGRMLGSAFREKSNAKSSDINSSDASLSGKKFTDVSFDGALILIAALIYSTVQKREGA